MVRRDANHAATVPFAEPPPSFHQLTFRRGSIGKTILYSVYETTGWIGNRALRAVSPSGRPRVLVRGMGAMTLQDVSRDARVLMTHDLTHVGFVTRGLEGPGERDLSWFDWSLLADLSDDGRTALISESGEAGGSGYSVFIRGTDGSPADRLGEGQALSLSPDGKRVLAILHPTTDQQLVIHPTGPGAPKVFSLPTLRVQSAAWLPDSRRFLMTAAEPGHESRVYLGDSEGGAPKPLTPEGFQGNRGVRWIEAQRFLARGPNEKVYVCSIEGGEPVPVPARCAKARPGGAPPLRNRCGIPRRSRADRASAAGRRRKHLVTSA